MEWQRIAGVLPVLAVLVVSCPAEGTSKALRTDQVRTLYNAPKNPNHQPIYDWLRGHRVLEQLRVMLSPLRLPGRLLIEVKGCDGEVNAFYESRRISVCFEYFEPIRANAPKVSTPGGLTPGNALVGPTIEVFLHEVGHAVFDMLQVPILGREEDAADYFAAYILLRFSPKDARRLIQGVAFSLATEVREALQSMPELKKLGDEHGLPAQRYFNLLCIAYGSDPATFGGAIERGGLPKDRAENCVDEFKTLDRAFRKLIRPYIDQRLLRSVRKKVRFEWEPNVPEEAGRDRPPLTR